MQTETECQWKAKETPLNATETGTFLFATVHFCLPAQHINLVPKLVGTCVAVIFLKRMALISQHEPLLF